MNYVTRLRDVLFGLYAVIIFAFCVIFGLLVAIFVPGAERRARWLGRRDQSRICSFRNTRRGHGYDNLPDVDCVVVANHASYVDGFLLKGYLPARFSFVIKGEMRSIPVVHFLLRRAGSRFVERNESKASSRDARQIVKAAQERPVAGDIPRRYVSARTRPVAVSCRRVCRRRARRHADRSGRDFGYAPHSAGRSLSAALRPIHVEILPPIAP